MTCGALRASLILVALRDPLGTCTFGARHFSRKAGKKHKAAKFQATTRKRHPRRYFGTVCR